jgi:hypothetical protein
MTRGICLTASALVLLSAPAFAQDKCGPSPAAPVVPKGKDATVQQLNATAQDIKAFVKASDDWQVCMKTDLDAQMAAAKDAKQPFDNKIKVSIEQKGDANQKDKDRVGKEYATAVADWRKAHPK